MAEGSTRGRRSTAGPLLVAVIFLAVLGAGTGYSLGALARDGRASAGSTTGGPTHGPTGANTDTATPPVQSSTNNNTNNGGTTNTGNRCPKHTEDLANAGPLTTVLYLHTAQSEVWVCKSGDGTLFYQGHKGQPGGALVEGDTALYLSTIDTEGGNGYVATNTDPNNGHVTKYHVTRDQLVIEYVWTGRKESQPAI